MRKLAREMVIFMLLTSVATFAGDFIYLYHGAHRLNANSSATQTPQALPMIDAKTMKTFRPVAPSDPWTVVNVTPPMPATPAFTPIFDLLGYSLLFGVYGFPAGFGLWSFYRIVRFAIKG